MLTLALLLIFITISLIGYVIIPSMYNQATIVGDKRQQKLSATMEQLMSRQEAKKISRLFVFAPIIFGVLCYMFFPKGIQMIGVVFGIILGFVFPGLYIAAVKRRNKDKFDGQLVDALMIMSSSFRGGLSLIQAIEAVVDEMPDPINKEFGTVLGENKMGVSLDEALEHLYKRVPSPALQQMITAILLARETGGNLPAIFSRISTTIRENRKIQQNLDTLTIQGKIQGFVMSLLPIGFAFIVYSANPRIFNHMLTSDLGRVMLVYALISETIGAFLIWKISTFKDF